MQTTIPLLDPVFRCWKTIVAMAADIGESENAVRQWKRRDSIPARYWPSIITAAAARGHTIDCPTCGQAIGTDAPVMTAAPDAVREAAE